VSILILPERLSTCKIRKKPFN